MINVKMPDGSVVKVTRFQLLQWKHAIGLEMKGLRHSRGSVTAHVKRVFGLKRSARKQVIFDFLSEILDSVEAQASV